MTNYRKKFGATFLFSLWTKKIKNPVWSFLPSFSGWVQHFCCYTLALQRILAQLPKGGFFVQGHEATKTFMGVVVAPSILSSWYMTWKFLGCFFILNGVGGTGRRYLVDLWMGILWFKKWGSLWSNQEGQWVKTMVLSGVSPQMTFRSKYILSLYLKKVKATQKWPNKPKEATYFFAGRCG